MPQTIYEVLRKILPELEKPENNTFDYIRWKSICSMTFTMERRMIKQTWDILLDQKVLVMINGKVCKPNHDRIYELLGTGNSKALGKEVEA